MGRHKSKKGNSKARSKKRITRVLSEDEGIKNVPLSKGLKLQLTEENLSMEKFLKKGKEKEENEEKEEEEKGGRANDGDCESVKFDDIASTVESRLILDYLTCRESGEGSMDERKKPKESSTQEKGEGRRRLELEEEYGEYNTNLVFSTNLEGSSSTSKLAPRSGLQFKVGPPFKSTVIDTPLFCSSDHDQIIPVINSRVDRGFDQNHSGEWIGYKRNYFTLVTSFFFENMSLERIKGEQFHIYDGKKVEIKYFALRLVSRCCEDNSLVHLIQHTAKRDKGPQVAPPIFPALPGKLPGHKVIKNAANIRNNNKIANYNKLFYLPNSFRDDEAILPTSIIHSYPPDLISIAARYERIQFSSSISCRKYSISNRHFKLGIQLLGYVEDGGSYILCHSYTPKLIVRGRSPSNYADENRVPEGLSEMREKENEGGEDIQDNEEGNDGDGDEFVEQMKYLLRSKRSQKKQLCLQLYEEEEEEEYNDAIEAKRKLEDKVLEEMIQNQINKNSSYMSTSNDYYIFSESLEDEENFETMPRSLNFFENREREGRYEDLFSKSQKYNDNKYMEYGFNGILINGGNGERVGELFIKNNEVRIEDGKENEEDDDDEEEDEEEENNGDSSFLQFQQELQNVKRKCIR